ncbi:MAG: ribosome small subunit-dependent GTPase A, partial [Candidatus Hydrogenedentota bacterium]
CVLCVNKTDLTVEGPSQVAAYREQGVSVFLTSCETGAGIGELSEQLRERVSVVAGQSGVGKSSLLNRLDPSLEIDTQEVSGYNDKGKHTTTGARLYRLANGIIVIDTPGIRQLGIANVSINELPFYFPEFAARAGACQFSDCTHTHEPNCAVREAVESGEVSAHRYGSYLRIREDITARATKY